MFVIKFYTSELLGTTVLHSHNIEKQCEIKAQTHLICRTLFLVNAKTVSVCGAAQVKFYTSEHNRTVRIMFL